jgi:retron-type reverse transcriptase
MDRLETAPAWLLRPLPLNAQSAGNHLERIDALGANLPKSLPDLHRLLSSLQAQNTYDEMVNRASAHVWGQLEHFYTSQEERDRLNLLEFARDHLIEQARARVYRRLAKDPSIHVRRRAHREITQARLPEVALPLETDGAWDTSGWSHAVRDRPLTRHPQGRRVQQQLGLPEIATVGELRALLGIRSSRQLGWMLLASDQGDGPYIRFTIPKRDGSERSICAPKKQLRWTQRQILDQILSKIQPHDAAHGFREDRSTVTNATPHLGAQLLLKFDLTDFFPTVHYYRVVGLFTRLGYTVGDARFRSSDDAQAIAPVLARLCCYTPDPQKWRNALMPQGAPTSPALSNLVCRRLDARLTGLAQGNGGVYTRYADDLTFSFKSKELNIGRFRWWVDQICHQEGFFVNQRKFRVIRASQRQVVTGIVVNDELRLPRDERRRFRAILHNCRKLGVESQSRGHARFADYLRGFASYVHMVHPEEGAELLRQIEALLGPEKGD